MTALKTEPAARALRLAGPVPAARAPGGSVIGGSGPGAAGPGGAGGDGGGPGGEGPVGGGGPGGGGPGGAGGEGGGVVSFCGDGVVDADEDCDLTDVQGFTCADNGLVGGQLGCNAECTFDLASCGPPGVLFDSDLGYLGWRIDPGQPLPCDDISTTGVPSGLSDEGRVMVPLGFDFSAYGTLVSDVALHANGALSFGSAPGNLSFTNQCSPTNVGPANALYAFWDDLRPGVGAGQVRSQTLGDEGQRRFVAQWSVAFFSGSSSDLIDVRAMLDEATGRIDVCYVDTTSSSNQGNHGAGATVAARQLVRGLA